MPHVPVLLQEAIDRLQIKPGEIFVDATVGGGGHSELVCKTFGKDVRIVGIDTDSEAIARSRERLSNLPCDAYLVEGNFRNIKEILKSISIFSVDNILFDLGFSSNQMEESGRGFSFQRDEPLIMTLSNNPPPGALTARDIVNNFEEDNLKAVIRGFGEDRFAGRIARSIVEHRQKKPILRTGELVGVIEAAVPKFYRRGRIHPATRTFQALRIAVNDVLGALNTGLKEAFDILKPSGRIAVISFHSGEDRVVKRLFRSWKDEGKATLVTRKPIVPSEEEVAENPKARSAKLRIVERKS